MPNTGWIHKLVCFATDGILADRRYRVSVIRPTWRPYEHSLNRIALDVLSQGWDYWLNIDSDNPPINNPLDLVELDLDLVGCPTPVWANLKPGDSPIYWNALDAVDDGWRPHTNCEGLQEVDAIGSGCFLMARRTLEAVERPWFERTTDANGLVQIGPDYNFCRKAKAAGCRVHAHYDYPCRHFNELDLVEMLEAMGAMRGPVQAS